MQVAHDGAQIAKRMVADLVDNYHKCYADIDVKMTAGLHYYKHVDDGTVEEDSKKIDMRQEKLDFHRVEERLKSDSELSSSLGLVMAIK